MNWEKRLSVLRNFMQERNIQISLILDSYNQNYFCGFKTIPRSRQAILIIKPETTALIVPGLNEAQAKTLVRVKDIYSYWEIVERAKYGLSYLNHLNNILSSLSPASKIGVEFNSLNVVLANHLKTFGYELIDISDKIAGMRCIKDEEEIETIIEAGKLVSLALGESIKNARAGTSELELDEIGNRALFEEATKKYPNSTVESFAMTQSGHSKCLMLDHCSDTRRLQRNDVVIHSRQVALNGYRAECERTFFVGKPTDKQKEALKLAIKAQEAAMSIVRVGIQAKEVDMAGCKMIREAEYGEYLIHRTGHGIGLQNHEEPFLRFDSDLVLREGMAITIEPGIYIPDVGGFRHSDTLILTESGVKLITEYPREINDLIM
jgi:Xaa-Pro dipeptidase